MQDCETADGKPFRLVAAPVQYDEQPATPGRAPEFNEHGDEILGELGPSSRSLPTTPTISRHGASGCSRAHTLADGSRALPIFPGERFGNHDDGRRSWISVQVMERPATSRLPIVSK